MAEQTQNPHSVVVYFRMPGEDLTQLYALERQLTTALADAGAGTYDGHEIALLDGDDAYLFLVGPDADRLYDAAQPVLTGSSLLKGAEITLRYGSADDEDVLLRRLPLN